MPATVNILQDDIGAAIVARMRASDAFDDLLGGASSTLRVEYRREAVTAWKGAQGSCLVRPGPVVPVRVFADSTSIESDFNFALAFALVDYKQRKLRVTEIPQALTRVFGDAGVALLAAITDSGSNRLGKGGLVTIEPEPEDVLDGAGAPIALQWNLIATLWHKQVMS